MEEFYKLKLPKEDYPDLNVNIFNRLSESPVVLILQETPKYVNGQWVVNIYLLDKQSEPPGPRLYDPKKAG
jgi:hypothetical protein